jgi:hypothetical protein
VYEEPAVCHHCDEVIDVFDVKCFSCQTDRSRYNRNLYNGPSALPPVHEETVPDDTDDEGEEGGDGGDDDDEGSDSGAGDFDESAEADDDDDDDGDDDDF